ncbi:hypothetical protein XENOCAPTIV_013536 [Xenoophorus captivus]|uniref:Uncharacterized protein n=1 Tax=Xenoophorus captivus TaxID=1517983 RepID=A0ABV0RWK8_9TELE
MLWKAITVALHSPAGWRLCAKPSLSHALVELQMVVRRVRFMFSSVPGLDIDCSVLLPVFNQHLRNNSLELCAEWQVPTVMPVHELGVKYSVQYTVVEQGSTTLLQ